MNIPEDMALIGCDDVDLAELMRPPLTIIRQPVMDLGRTAAELLFKRLSHVGPKEPPEHIILPVELVLRSSCGCIAIPQRSAHPAYGSFRDLAGIRSERLIRT